MKPLTYAEINTELPEGKLLVAALTLLSEYSASYLHSTVPECLTEANNLAQHMFEETEPVTA